MTTVALVSRVQNDAHVRVTDVEEGFTMDEVAAACALPAIDCQTPHPGFGKPLRVRLTTDDDSAKPFDRGLTVKQAGFTHFDCVDVFVE